MNLLKILKLLIQNNIYIFKQGILLVCDLTEKETFNNLSKWEKKLKNNDLLDKKAVVILVGNKNDLPNKVIHTFYKFS